MEGFSSNLNDTFTSTRGCAEPMFFPQHILPLLPLYNAQWWGYESLTAIVLVLTYVTLKTRIQTIHFCTCVIKHKGINCFVPSACRGIGWQTKDQQINVSIIMEMGSTNLICSDSWCRAALDLHTHIRGARGPRQRIKPQAQGYDGWR